MVSKVSQSGSVNLYVQPAELEHCLYIAQNMREADRQEVSALSGKDPLDAMIVGYKYSDMPFTIMADDKPAAMFGAGPVQPDVGAVWLLGTDLILQNTTRFLRESRFWLDQVSKPYGLMCNFVDARNTVHIRWIKWLGFTFINLHEKFGVEQRPFYEFVRIC